MDSDGVTELGSFVTATEARGLAAILASGQHVSKALHEISPGRRDEVRELMNRSGLSHTNADLSVSVLRAISGAKATQLALTPVWTMPGHEAAIGYLTSQFHSLVAGARQSVTCATYNFETTSQMWTVLREASEEPGVVVTVYVDGDKADGTKVKQQMPKATVFRSASLPNGTQVVSHAKFVIIDHSVMLLTSANFSYSAENRNVEFGVLINDPGLAESVEHTMASKHGVLYERVD